MKNEPKPIKITVDRFIGIMPTFNPNTVNEVHIDFGRPFTYVYVNEIKKYYISCNINESKRIVRFLESIDKNILVKHRMIYVSDYIKRGILES